MYRKNKNTGVFSNLQIPMQKRYINKLSNKYGINISNLNIKIQRDVNMVNTEFCGSTDYNNIGRIDLFPNAFKTEEQLIRTIIHEKCHVKQLMKYGKEYSQNNLITMEKQAYKYESIWYNILKKKVK